MSGIIINPYSFATGSAFSSTKSLNFDGTDDYLSCGNLTALNGLSHGSWSFWLNSSVTSTNGIFNQWGTGTDRLIYSWIQMSSGRLDLYFDGGAKYRVTGNSIINALNTGDWFNLVIVFDGTLPNTSDENGRLKVYINGTVLSDGISFVTGPTAMPSTTSDLILGNAFTFGSFWEGNMDEVAIWNSSLTQAAVTEIYNAGTPNNLDELTNATDPSAWYRMGENSTFSSPQILMPENTNKDNISNYSMDFDGVGDFVSIYDGASSSGPIQFDAGDDFSISAWIKTTNAGTTNQIVSFRGTAIIWFSTFKTSGNIRLKIYLRDDSSNVYTLDSYNSASGWITSDTWTNVMFTRNGTSKAINLYINGVPAQVTGTDTTSDNFTAYDKLSLGNDNYSGGRYWFDGNMDEVAIYDSDESGNAVTIATTPLNDLTSLSPVAYWKMGEEAVFNSSNWLLPNKAQDVFSRYSMEFDGVGDYIDCGTGIGTSFGDGYTGGMVVSLWFKADITSGDDGLFTFGGTNSYGELSAALKANYLDVFVAGSSKLHHSFTNTTDWHNLVINLDGSATSTNQVYLDGVPIGSTFGTYTALDLDAVTFFIAQYWSASYPFQGKIDEVAIFNTAKAIGDLWDGSGKPTDLTGESGIVAWWRMGEDATFSTNWTIPDQIGSNTGTSANMTNDDLSGDAPGVTGNGVSDNMTIENRVGDAPDSSNNALSYNMDAADIDPDTP